MSDVDLSVYARLTRHAVERTRTVPDPRGGSIMLDLDADGEVVGVEILGAIEVTAEYVRPARGTVRIPPEAQARDHARTQPT